MKYYHPPTTELWSGRASRDPLYWYQRVKCINLLNGFPHEGIAILSYAVEEGVRRNHGRIGTSHGPSSIIRQLGGLSDHINSNVAVYDVGSIACTDLSLESVHETTSAIVKRLLDNDCIPIILGGGHDLAYAHYKGLVSHVASDSTSLGIVNLDAHFDLRRMEDVRNSGTPFYQIGEECRSEDRDFNYLCLGIQSASNNRNLFEYANERGVTYIEMDEFQITNWLKISDVLDQFLNKIDFVYLTIDLDGFDSSYAPGVSAPSPMGFDPALALKVINKIIASRKLLSLDIVELNPHYDQDNITAKLAARLVEHATINLAKLL